MNNIKIKQIGLTESHLVVGLFNQYRIFYNQFSDIGMAKAFIDERLQHNESIIFLAIDEDTEKPVGFTQLYPKFSSAKLSKNWILNDLYVDEVYRKQGIGEKLIKTAMEFSKTTGATFIQLETAVDNYTAQQLYENIGFEKQGNDEEFFLYKMALNS
ncbi:GNAT family N-acetyltransferase [Pedobacter sp. KBS0701]|uniref:GNAT family N-acetyltransferase n=1 Tax=Pedobacter sp. KBS0701 TaxID=2578106 RepID=UPI00110D8A6D|nr:GNAT family N-acetyltransferase [Pedobacter sp. KBS0701]QDW26799.1 GNAT family N-acetyltransferase [Pedobacter sp. KBS0701]